MAFQEPIQTLSRAPAPSPDWALFLDFDGTIVDVAATPDAVEVPKTLLHTLDKVSTWLGGAVAIVSGRPIEQIDRLLAPLRLPCVGEHGATMRSADGKIVQSDPDCAVPADLRKQLIAATQSWDGVAVENKIYGVTVHFRQAPDRENDVRKLVEAVLSGAPEVFEMIPARMAYEIRHRTLHKGHAVNQLLQQPPFQDRLPVFVGDDITDEDGFRSVRAQGGLALHVNDVFDGKPAEVRQWLAQFGQDSVAEEIQ